jgi:hypothetical protein
MPETMVLWLRQGKPFPRDIWYLYTIYLLGQYGNPAHLHSDHDTRVFIPRQQRIVTILGARFGNICSTCHKVLMQICARKATRNRRVHWFHNFKVGREQDVEIALVDLLLISDEICLNQGGDLQVAS